jgi:hypothetical protein
MVAVGMAYQELEECKLVLQIRLFLGSRQYRKRHACVRIKHVPLDLISCVHPLSSSCTSSGPISLRSHASCHRGSGGAVDASAWSAFFLDTPAPSLLLKTFEKKAGMSAQPTTSGRRAQCFQCPSDCSSRCSSGCG